MGSLQGPPALEAQSRSSLMGDTEGIGLGQEGEGGAQGAFGDPSPRKWPRGRLRPGPRSAAAAAGPQNEACDADDQALHLALRPGWGLGQFRALQDPLQGRGQGQEPGPSAGSSKSQALTRGLQACPGQGLPLKHKVTPEAPLPALPQGQWAWGASSRGGRGGTGVTAVLGVGRCPAQSLAALRPPCPGGSHPALRTCAHTLVTLEPAWPLR